MSGGKELVIDQRWLWWRAAVTVLEELLILLVSALLLLLPLLLQSFCILLFCFSSLFYTLLMLEAALASPTSSLAAPRNLIPPLLQPKFREMLTLCQARIWASSALLSCKLQKEYPIPNCQKSGLDC